MGRKTRLVICLAITHLKLGVRVLVVTKWNYPCANMADNVNKFIEYKVLNICENRKNYVEKLVPGGEI